MWIRSQDKQKLGNYSFIFARGKEIAAETNMDVDTLGEYKTVERTIEVLDKMQSHVETLEYLKVRPEAWQGELLIYQMPQE